MKFVNATMDMLKEESDRIKNPMYVTKDELASSGKRFFRYIDPNKDENNGTFFSYTEDGVNICERYVVLEEALSFMEASEIFAYEGKYGDYFAEVIFDPKDPDFKKLDKWYFNDGVMRGLTMKLGKFMKVGSPEYEALKAQYDKRG